jgi:hypothetical protein
LGKEKEAEGLSRGYIAEEGLCDIGKLLRQQHIVEGSSALSRAAAHCREQQRAAHCRRQQRVVEGSSALSRAGAHDVRETTVVTVTDGLIVFTFRKLRNTQSPSLY